MAAYKIIKQRPVWTLKVYTGVQNGGQRSSKHFINCVFETNVFQSHLLISKQAENNQQHNQSNFFTFFSFV